MRKGQVTIFVIIGIAILLAVFLYLYLQDETSIFNPEITVPEDVVPIVTFVESCVYDAARDAILTIGMQGGFIEIPADIRRERASYLSVDPYNLLIRPLWYYKGQTRIPTEPYLKYQISHYIEEQLPVCVDNFKSFSHLFEIIEGNARITTTLQDTTVSIELNYPLEIHNIRDSKITKIELFKQEVHAGLKPAYELAKNIMISENDQHFLENVTIDLMASNPDIPFTGMEFSCGAITWRQNDVQQEIQDMLFYNLPRIRIANTDYAPFEADKQTYDQFAQFTMEDINNGDLPSVKPPSDAYEYFHFLFEAGSTNPRLKAKIVYRPEYGMDFFAHPSKDGVMRSDKLEGPSEFLRFLCMNLYHFVYDVTYPVEVYIRDDQSFGGEGYVFAFGFPVVLYHNQPDRSVKSVRQYDIPFETEGFCDEAGPEAIVTVLGTYEGYTDMEIPDVDITYECLQHRCDLGSTAADGGHYRLRTTVPGGCFNPLITANKTGYLAAHVQMTGDEINIPMQKLNSMEFEVVKHKYNLGTLGEAESLEEDDQVIISLRLINGTYDQNLIYPIPENGTTTISIVEDTASYDMDAVFITSGDYAGGYVDRFDLTMSDVLGMQKMIIHVVEYLPTPISDQQKIEMVDYLMQGTYIEPLKPEQQ